MERMSSEAALGLLRSVWRKPAAAPAHSTSSSQRTFVEAARPPTVTFDIHTTPGNMGRSSDSATVAPASSTTDRDDNNSATATAAAQAQAQPQPQQTSLPTPPPIPQDVARRYVCTFREHLTELNVIQPGESASSGVSPSLESYERALVALVSQLEGNAGLCRRFTCGIVSHAAAASLDSNRSASAELEAGTTKSEMLVLTPLLEAILVFAALSPVVSLPAPVIARSNDSLGSIGSAVTTTSTSTAFTDRPGPESAVFRVQELLLRTFVVLGRQSMSPQESALVLELMTAGCMAVVDQIRLSSSMQEIARIERPLTAISVDGMSGGVQLPLVGQRWPSSAYSISMWFCVNTFEHPEDRTQTPFYEPRLFSMLTNKGNGLELYFYARQLVVRTNQSNKASFNITFAPGTWYHLVVVHRLRLLERFRGSTLDLYLNGEVVGSASLRYPADEPISSCTMGSSAPFETAFLSVPRDSTLRGELGPALVFSEGVSADYVADLFRTGFDYCPNFADEESDLLMAPATAPRVLVGFAPVASNILQRTSTDDADYKADSNSKTPPISPKTSKWNVGRALTSLLGPATPTPSKPITKPRQLGRHEFFNLARLQTSTSNKALMSCISIGNSEIVRVSQFRSSVYSALDPTLLIAMFEAILRQHALELRSTSSDSVERDRRDSVTTELINSLLRLIGEILWAHPAGCHAFSSKNGFTVLGYLLKRVAARLGPDSIASVEFIVEAAAQAAARASALAIVGTDRQDSGGSIFSSLSDRGKAKASLGRTRVALEAVLATRAFAAACHSLLWDFSVWISAPFEVQRRVIYVINNHASRYRSLFRRVPATRGRAGIVPPSFGVQRLIDVLRNYYWMKIPPSGTAADRYTSRRRLSLGQIAALRLEIIGVIETLVCGNASPHPTDVSDAHPDVSVDHAFAVTEGESLERVGSRLSLPSFAFSAASALASVVIGQPDEQIEEETDNVVGVAESELRGIIVFLEDCGDPHQLEDLLLFVLRQLLMVAEASKITSKTGLELARAAALETHSRNPLLLEKASVDLRLDGTVSARDMYQRFDAVAGRSRKRNDKTSKFPLEGMGPFWSLTFHSNQAVRVLALRVVTAYLNLHPDPTRHKWLEANIGPLCAPRRGDKSSSLMLDGPTLVALAEMATSRWMFDVARDDYSSPSHIVSPPPLVTLMAPSLETAEDGSSQSSSAPHAAVPNPQVIPAIFSAMINCDTPGLNASILQEMIILSDSDSELGFAQAFMGSSGWQSWIVWYLVTAGQKWEASHAAQGDFFEQSECTLAVALLARLLRHTFCRRDGFKTAEDVEACIESFNVSTSSGPAEQYAVSRDRLTRAVFISLVQHLRSSPDLGPDPLSLSEPRSLAIWRNVCEFVKVVDAHAHYPNLAAHHTRLADDSGHSWNDADLFAELLLLFDNCLQSSARSLLFSVPGFTEEIGRAVVSLSLLSIQEALLQKPTRTLPQNLVAAHARSLRVSPSAAAPQIAASAEMLKRCCARAKPILMFLVDDFAAWDTENASKVQSGEELVARSKARSLTELQAKTLLWVLHTLFLVLRQAIKLRSGEHSTLEQLELAKAYESSAVPFVKELLRVFAGHIERFLIDGKSLEGAISFRVPPGADTPVSREGSTETFMSWFSSNSLFFFPGSDVSNALHAAADGMERMVAEERISVTERMKRVDASRKHHERILDGWSTTRATLDEIHTKIVTRHAAHEVQRLRNLEVEADDAVHRDQSDWRKLNHHFSHYRSPLGTFGAEGRGRDTSTLRVYDKLDSWESCSRMRLRMKRNFEGRAHAGASVHGHGHSQPAAETTDEELDAQQKLMLSSIAVSKTAKSEDVDLQALSAPQEVKIILEKTAPAIDDEQNESEMVGFEFETANLEQSWCVMDSATAGAAEFGASEVEKRAVARSATEGKVIVSVACELVFALSKTPGNFMITPVRIHWIPGETAEAVAHYKQWDIRDVASVQRRRFQLRNNAIEIFFQGSRSVLLNFPENGARKQVLAAIKPLLPSVLRPALAQTPQDVLRLSGLTEKWQNWKISNFDYLMALNTIAGRSFNDLTQYPVFPWVVTDYESDDLRLDDPNIFRDLSKPVGALEPGRLEKLLDRYQSLKDVQMDTPPFLYGSHYSTLGSVLFFLIRVEPFTTLFVDQVQGGKFDIADRMFHSIPQAWNNCLTSPSDVKELIPECYYLAEMYENGCGFDMGTRQDGEKLDNVVLPRWAKGSSQNFVRGMRRALESDYVSANLHNWIDLIFGFKQRGEAAEKANNVFYHLTYEGEVDLDQISDPAERQALEAQISNFGQTPSQLLQSPHPQKLTKPAGSISLFNRLVAPNGAALPVRKFLVAQFSRGVFPSCLSMSACRIVDSSCEMDVRGKKRFASKSVDSHKVSVKLTCELVAIDPTRLKGRCYRVVARNIADSSGDPTDSLKWETELAIKPLEDRPFKVPFRSECLPPMVLLHGDAGSDTYVVGRAGVCVSKWDRRCMRVFDPHTLTTKGFRSDGVSTVGRLLQIIQAHDAPIICMTSSVDSPGRYGELSSSQAPQEVLVGSHHGAALTLVTGSEDCSVKIWDWRSTKSGTRVSPRPRHILRGHVTSVVHVSLSEDLDLVASCGADGVMIIHSLRSGNVSRILKSARFSRAPQLFLLSPTGDVVAYWKDPAVLACWNMNGKLLAEEFVDEDLSAICISKDNEFLVTGGTRVVIRQKNDLRAIRFVDIATSGEGRVRTIQNLSDESGVLVCLDNGKLMLISSATDVKLVQNKGK